MNINKIMRASDQRVLEMAFTRAAQTAQEELLATEAARILQEEIDWELLADMMVACGYTRVVSNRRYRAEEYAAVRAWTDQNIKGHFRAHAGEFLFKDPHDATLFSLRWL